MWHILLLLVAISCKQFSASLIYEQGAIATAALGQFVFN